MPAGWLALVRSHRSLCNCLATQNQSTHTDPYDKGDASQRKVKVRIVVQGIASEYKSTAVPRSNHRTSRKPGSNETNTDQLLLTGPETFHVRVCQTGSSDRLVVHKEQ